MELSTEQVAAVVGAVVLLLSNTAALVKVWADNAKTKEDRAATRVARDQDSQALHDAVQKATWDIAAIKNENGHREQVIEQLQQQISILNSTMATTNTKLDMLCDVIKELKEPKRRNRG